MSSGSAGQINDELAVVVQAIRVQSPLEMPLNLSVRSRDLSWMERMTGHHTRAIRRLPSAQRYYCVAPVHSASPGVPVLTAASIYLTHPASARPNRPHLSTKHWFPGSSLLLRDRARQKLLALALQPASP